MTIDYAEAQRLTRKHKGALTRAKKKGPDAVIGACHAFVADFDAARLPWPDAWHTWNIAFGDAHVELGNGFGHHLDEVR